MCEVRVSPPAPPLGSSLPFQAEPLSGWPVAPRPLRFFPTHQPPDATPHPAPDPGSTSFLTSRLPGSTSGSEGGCLDGPGSSAHRLQDPSPLSATSALGTRPGTRMPRMRHFLFPADAGGSADYYTFGFLFFFSLPRCLGRFMVSPAEKRLGRLNQTIFSNNPQSPMTC